MRKLAILKIGAGTFQSGFAVTLRIDHLGASIDGHLAPAPDWLDLYDEWQFSYRRHIEYATPQKPTSRATTLNRHANNLEKGLNDWLNVSPKFRRIRDQLLRTFSQPDEIHFVIEANELELWQIPWHLWDLLQEHPNVEVACSLGSYTRVPTVCQDNRAKKVRVLVVLGDTRNLDVEQDSQALRRLLPDAEFNILSQPSRKAMSDELWDQSWNLLYFAGHSSSYAGEGRIYLNEQDSLTIEELKESLGQAISQGLQLAIFNSCDGLGLAQDLAGLNMPATIVMRERIPDQIAHQFLRDFLQAFACEQQSLYAAARQARRKLHILEQESPCASWLPVICQSPAANFLFWTDFLPKSPLPPPLLPLIGSFSWSAALIISSLVTIGIIMVRGIGWLEPMELLTQDMFMRSQPSSPSPQTFITVITVDDRDIEQSKQALARQFQLTPQQWAEPSLLDQSLYQLLTLLQDYDPAVIGLDIARDEPLPPGTTLLLDYLSKNTSVIGICDVGEPGEADPRNQPSGMPINRLGFADGLILDRDDVIRRYALEVHPVADQTICPVRHSFAYQVTWSYQQQLKKEFPTSLKDQIPDNLTREFGAYQHPDADLSQEWQILIRYRPVEQITTEISLTQFLNGRASERADWVKHRIVLIGYIGNNAKQDYWPTPLGKMYGVRIHAQVIRQLLDALKASGNSALLSDWEPWQDILWVFVWSSLGSLVIWNVQGGVKLIWVAGGLLIILIGLCFYLFLQLTVVPCIPAALAFLVALPLGWSCKTMLQRYQTLPEPIVDV